MHKRIWKSEFDAVKPRRYVCLACAALARECYYAAARSRNLIDIRVIEQGLHDVGAEKMSARLQKEIDAAVTDAPDAVLLLYGLCENGTVGLRADVPMVIPRAHDCITLLLGSKEKYRQVFDDNPGTFYWSSGWVERAVDHTSNPDSVTSKIGLNSTYEEFVKLYGEDNAAYLMETLGDTLKNYSKYVYIDMGVADERPYREIIAARAAEMGLAVEEIEGDMGLIVRLMAGDWDAADFLVVSPGENVQPSYDAAVVRAVKKENSRAS